MKHVIQLDSGPVVFTDKGIYRWIPYAAPPLKDLRWAPPRPVTPWTEPRRFDTFGPVCPQMNYDGSMSEDCLCLNVWTPKQGAGPKLPVMVWIHGSAIVSGSGSDLPVKSTAELWSRMDQVITAKWFGAWADYMACTAVSLEQTWFYRFTRQPSKRAAKVLAEDSQQPDIPYKKLGTCHSSELF